MSGRIRPPDSRSCKLDTMPVIEQAKGILMAQCRCGPDEAFDLLCRASQNANVKVNVLAKRIVKEVSEGKALPVPPAGTSRLAAGAILTD